MDSSPNSSEPNFEEYEIYRETINTVFYIIYLPVAFIGNLFTVIIVTYIVRHQRTRRSIPDLCLGLLAIVDLFSVLFIHTISAFSEGKGYILLSPELCNYQAFCISLYFKLQFLIQILICLDRHFALVQPLRYRRFSSIRSMKIALSVIVVTTFATSGLTLVMSLMGGDVIGPNVKVLDTWTICVFTWTMSKTMDYVISGVLIIIFLVGFVAFVVCNITLVRLLWHYHRNKTTMVWREITKAVEEMHKPLYKSPNLTPKTPLQRSPIMGCQEDCKPLMKSKSDGKSEHELLAKNDGENNEQANILSLENKSISSGVKAENQLLNQGFQSLTKRNSNSLRPDLSSNRSGIGNDSDNSKVHDVENTSEGSNARNEVTINVQEESPNGEGKSIGIVHATSYLCKHERLSDGDEGCFDNMSTVTAGQQSKTTTPPETGPVSRQRTPESNVLHGRHPSTKSQEDDSEVFSANPKDGENRHLNNPAAASTDSSNTLQITSPGVASSSRRHNHTVSPSGSITQRPSTSSICSSSSRASSGKIKKSVSFARDSRDTENPKSPSLSTSLRLKTMRHLGEDVAKQGTNSPDHTPQSSDSHLKIRDSEDIRPSAPRTPDIIIDYASTEDHCEHNSFHKPDLLNETSPRKVTASPNHEVRKSSAVVNRQASLSPPTAMPRRPIQNGTALTTSSNPTPQNVFDFSQRSIHSYKSGISTDDPLRHFQHQVKKVLKKLQKTTHKQKREIFLARIVLLCATIFVISWMPYIVVIFLSMVKVEVNAILEDIAMRCIFLNAVFNPIFYGLCRRNYRKGYDYITQACCHVISCGIVDSPSDDKVFFESRRRKQKRHLDAAQRVKLIGHDPPRLPKQARRQSKPAMQILQQTLNLRSNSLRQIQEMGNISPKDSVDRSPRSPHTVPEFRPSKHLQDLFQRYMEETDSSEEEISSIDYEALICDDDEMYNNLKRVISIYMTMEDMDVYEHGAVEYFGGLNNITGDITRDGFSSINTNDGFSMLTDDDIDLDIDYDALIDDNSENVQCLLSSSSPTPQTASETELRNIKQDSNIKPGLKFKLGLPAKSYLRQQSCPVNTMSKSGADDESYV